MEFEYKYSPDALDLLVSTNEVTDLCIQQLETAFGNDEAKYVYKEGILLGVIVEANDYYKGLNIESEGKLSISLVPAMRNSSGIELPSYEEFESKLSKVLNTNSINWVLICEQDCEQNPVIRTHQGTESAHRLINQLFEFCKTGNVSCPTFVIER